MAGRCSPPRSVEVKPYDRKAPRQLKRAAAKRSAALGYVVRDSRNGRVMSRHRTWGAAVRARARYDRASARAGRGRPYEAGKA